MGMIKGSDILLLSSLIGGGTMIVMAIIITIMSLQRRRERRKIFAKFIQKVNLVKEGKGMAVFFAAFPLNAPEEKIKISAGADGFVTVWRQIETGWFPAIPLTEANTEAVKAYMDPWLSRIMAALLKGEAAFVENGPSGNFQYGLGVDWT